MAQKMDIFRKDSSIDKEEAQGGVLPGGPRDFAIHALACIRLHDVLNDDASGQGTVSIARIAALDKVLTNPRDVNSLYLLRAFGRHAIPAFQRLLREEYKVEDAAIETEVSEQYFELRSAFAGAE